MNFVKSNESTRAMYWKGLSRQRAGRVNVYANLECSEQIHL